MRGKKNTSPMSLLRILFHTVRKKRDGTILQCRPAPAWWRPAGCWRCPPDSPRRPSPGRRSPNGLGHRLHGQKQSSWSVYKNKEASRWKKENRSKSRLGDPQ